MLVFNELFIKLLVNLTKSSVIISVDFANIGLILEVFSINVPEYAFCAFFKISILIALFVSSL
jgi:hypothetical protein